MSSSRDIRSFLDVQALGDESVVNAVAEILAEGDDVLVEAFDDSSDDDSSDESEVAPAVAAGVSAARAGLAAESRDGDSSDEEPVVRERENRRPTRRARGSPPPEVDDDFLPELEAASDK